MELAPGGANIWGQSLAFVVPRLNSGLIFSLRSAVDPSVQAGATPGLCCSFPKKIQEFELGPGVPEMSFPWNFCQGKKEY